MYSVYPTKLFRLAFSFGGEKETYSTEGLRPMARHIQHLAVTFAPLPGVEDFSAVENVRSLFLNYGSGPLWDDWVPNHIRLARSWPLQRLWLGCRQEDGHHPLFQTLDAGEPFPPFHGRLTHLSILDVFGVKYFEHGSFSPCIKRGLTHLNLACNTNITQFFASLTTCISSLPSLKILALYIPYKALIVDEAVGPSLLPYDPRIVFYMLNDPIKVYAASWHEYAWRNEDTFWRMAAVVRSQTLTYPQQLASAWWAVLVALPANSDI